MATITSLNQYKASYPDATDMSVAAGSMEDALVALKEAKDMEPSMLQKTVTGIAVAIPAPAIAIETFVTGTGAAAAGCKATPYTIDSVENGDKVWFTAIAVVKRRKLRGDNRLRRNNPDNAQIRGSLRSGVTLRLGGKPPFLGAYFVEKLQI